MPRIQQPSVQIRDAEGIFLNGYTFIIGAPKGSLERAYFDDELFAYMEKRAREDPQFRGAYWEHFNDRDACGKHSIVGDHYHIAVTRQRPREGEASSSALGCWVRDKAKGYGTETLEGQNIFKPSGLFLYLRRPPRSLAYYTKSIKDLVFEKNGYKYLHHVPLEPGSLPEVPGVDEGCSGAGALFDPGSAQTKGGAVLFDVMSVIHKSKAGTIEQFQSWVLSRDPGRAATIMEEHFSKRNLNQTLATAMDWYPLTQLAKPWREQMGSVIKPEGVKVMSVERSLKMFDVIMKWQFIKDCIDIMEKSIQKENTLLLIGNSNAGKSQKAQSLAVTAAKISRLYQGLNNSFVFQDLLSKNVIIHQEALLAKASYEMFNLVMEGAVTDNEVAVKGKANALYGRIFSTYSRFALSRNEK